MVVFPSNTGKVVTVLPARQARRVHTRISSRIKVSKLERLSGTDSDFSPSELKRALRGGEAARKKMEEKRRGIRQPPLILLINSLP